MDNNEALYILPDVDPVEPCRAQVELRVVPRSPIGPYHSAVLTFENGRQFRVQRRGHHETWVAVGLALADRLDDTDPVRVDDKTDPENGRMVVPVGAFQ